MTSDVTLNAALRNNLLSLQNTQSLINEHQQHLATGKKVNNALDNPQEFFAAQTLSNSANDLSLLLDGITQSIQTINAANNGVTALTTLINQQQSIANTAQSTLAGASTNASQTGSVALTGSKTWSTITGLAANNVITINVTDPLGGTNKLVAQTYTVGATDTVNDVISHINDLNTTNNLTTPAISASLDASGHLNFTAVNGGTLGVQFSDLALQTDAGSLGVASALGFASIAKVNTNGNATTADITGFTAVATASLTSTALFTGGGTSLAQGSTLVSALQNTLGTSLTTVVATDTLKLSIAGKTSADLLHFGVATAATTTVQNVIDAINHDATIGSLVSASFNTTTGQLSITALTAAATDVQFQVGSAATGSKYNLGFGTSTLQTGTQVKAQEDVFFGAAAGTLGSLQTQYNTGLAQITALVSDTGYAGNNLLNGGNLTTFFDVSRTSSLTTAGVTFSAGGLGLTNANFNSASGIGTTVSQLQTALATVRNFGSTLANNLAVIQNRQTFTGSTINTLQSGSDALVNADQNAEGAALLALQTRQSLGVTSLSLASQANQSILKLFP